MEIMCINKYTEMKTIYIIIYQKNGKGERYEIYLYLYIVPKGEESFLLFFPSLLTFL